MGNLVSSDYLWVSQSTPQLTEHYQQLVRCMAESLGFEFALIGIQTPDCDHIRTLCIHNHGDPCEMTYPTVSTPCKITLQAEPYIIPANASELYPDDPPLVDMGTQSYAGARFHDAVTGRWGLVAGLSTKPITDVDHITNLITTFASSAEAARRAEAASLSRDRFIANLSHEIRTPMTAILGHADLLADPQTPTEEHGLHIATITNSGKHLLTLINDFLDTAKIESGLLKVQSVPMSPAQVAQDVVALHAPEARRKGNDLQLHCAPTIPDQVASDPVRLAQILGNLIDNANKFTDDGIVSVTVETEPDSPALLFRVADTGCGIHEDHAKRIFEPFSQVEQHSAASTGTGLGLSICSKLALLLGGSIELQSTPGAGSTFTLRIYPGDLNDPTSRNTQCAIPVTADALRGCAVLIVDDAEDSRRLFSMLLSRSGAKVTTAEDGDVALHSIRDNPPFDLILLDMQMPTLDGFATARAIREMGIDTPILALTAHAADTYERECLRAGCTAYLTKPAQRADLLDACARLTGMVTA